MRTIIRTIIITISILVLACACTPQEIARWQQDHNNQPVQYAPTVSTPKRVLHVGDSLTAYSAWKAFRSYTDAGYMANVHGYPGYSLSGLNAWGTVDMVETIQSLSSKLHPDVFVVELGTNDASKDGGKGVDMVEFASDVNQVIATANGKPLYWVLPFTCNNFYRTEKTLPQVVSIIRSAASANSNMHLIDLNFCGMKDIMIADGVHMTVAGEILFANSIVNSINK